MGACEQRLGRAEREFSQVSAVALIGPLRDFLEGDWSLITVSNRPICHISFVSPSVLYLLPVTPTYL